MAFPTTPLGVRVDMQVGGVWTDITSDTLNRDGIQIRRGRSSESGTADPSTCALSLKNPAGKYSPRNPSSPYYGLIGRNTPTRVGIGTPSAATGLAGQTGVSIVAPSVTAETAGLLVGVWAAGPVGNITLPGTFTGYLERDGLLSTWAAGSKTVAAGATGTSTATHSVAATSGAGMSVFMPGAAVTVTDTYSSVTTGGGAVTMSALPVVAGDYLLAIYGWSSDPYDVMHAVVVDTAGPCGWTLLADTGASTGPRVKAFIRRANVTGSISVGFYGNDFTGEAPDVYARVLQIAGVTDYLPRFTGDASDFPVKWDLSGRDVWVPIQSSGVTRRLGHGVAPLRSTMFRHLTRAVTPALVPAYWPMEDDAGATTMASAMSGAPPMYLLGAPVGAADDGFPGSAAVPTWTAAGSWGVVPTYATTGTGQFAVGAIVNWPAVGMTDQSVLLSFEATGTIATWYLKVDTVNNKFRLQGYSASGVLLLNTAPGPWAAPPTGKRFFVFVVAKPSGADLTVEIRYTPILPGATVTAGEFATVTVVGASAGIVKTVSVGTDYLLTGEPSIGHVVVVADPTLLSNPYTRRALLGWNGEEAPDRVARLCREEKVDVFVSLAVTGEAMGPQRPGGLLDLLRECEAADGGELYEPKGLLGIGYRHRVSLYGQSATAALSYSGGNISEPFEPVDDDQGVVNDVTVSRINGSSARDVLDVGPLSTLPPPRGIGRYDTSVPLSLVNDTRLAELASWRLALGTWDAARYPALTIDLAKNPSLVNTIAALDVGDYLTVSGLPAWLPPGPIDELVQGYTETIVHPSEWKVTANCSPAGLYQAVGVYDSTESRYSSDGSTLSAAATSTATSFSVATTSGPLWTLNAAMCPFSITVGGEQVTVTAVAGAASPQTFTVTRSVNGVVKAQTSGAVVELAPPAYFAL